MQLSSRSCFLVSGLALIFSGLAALPSQADIAPQWSDAELVRFSNVILTGRVAEVATGWDSGTIYTYVTVDVADVLKGSIPEHQIVIKQLGGRVDDLALLIGGQGTFTPGEQILVFLEVRPRDHTLSTTALWQGKWTITADPVSGQKIATRPIHSGSGRQSFGIAADTQRLQTFVSEIQGLAGDASRQPLNSTGIILHPREASAASRVVPVDATTIFTPAWQPEAQTRSPIPLEIQRSGQEGLPGAGFAEVLEAAQNVAALAGLTTMEAPTTSVACFTTFAGDGRLVVAFGDPCGEMSADGGTLAVGGTWVNASTLRMRNGDAFMQVLQAGVITNGGATASVYLTSSQCFDQIETHELGHALGGANMSGGSPILDRSCLVSKANSATSTVDVGLRFAGARLTAAATPAPSVVFVSPTSGYNYQPTTITISGSNFIATPRAQLGSVSLVVTFVNDFTVTAVVPADLPAGQYTITLTNPDGQSASSSIAFGILGSGDGTLGPWRRTSSLNVAALWSGFAVAAGRLFALGGQSTTRVEQANINADGTLSPWSLTRPVSTPTFRPSVLGIASYLYNFGVPGSSTAGGVERAIVNADGSLGPWEVLPNSLDRHDDGAVASDGSSVYLLNQKTVERAPISGGALGDWQLVASLIKNRQDLGATVVGRSLYALGGYDGTGIVNHTVERATINDDGSLTSWQLDAPLTGTNTNIVHSTTAGGYLYAAADDGIQRSRVHPAGSLEAWQVISSLPPGVSIGAGGFVRSGQYVFVIDAASGTVFSARLSPLSISSGAPSSGLVTGGTSITVAGANFLPGATVTFGGVAAANVTLVSATTLTVITPAHAAGAVNVVVTNGDGQTVTIPNGFTYQSSTGTVPGAPTALTASVGSASVTLTWTAPTSVGTPTTYIIETGSFSGGTNLGSLSTGSPSTSFTLTGVSAGTYYVRVRGANAAGTGPASNEVTLTIASACQFTLSSTGQNFGENAASGSVAVSTASGCSWMAVSNISWITVTSGATGTGSGTVSFVVSLNTSPSRRTGTITIAGQTLTVTQDGNPSATTTPGSPTLLSASVTGSSVILAWTAPSSAVGGTPTTYIVEAGSSVGAENLANFSIGNTATTFAAAGVGAGTYFVRVRAANSAGVSAASNEVVVFVAGTPSCTSPPGAPTALGFSLLGSTVTLFWGAGTGPITSYIVEAGSSTGLANLANFDTGVTAPTLTAVGVGNGTYYVRVRGKNACGTSGPSNEVLTIVR